MRRPRRGPLAVGLPLWLALALAGGATAAAQEGAPAKGARDGDGRPPLLAAARAGDIAEVERRLASGADPAARDVAGHDALMMAALVGDARLAGVLIDRGAGPAAASKKGFTALMLAAAAGHADVVRLLLARGAEPHARSLAGDTALILAANNGHAEVVDALLAAGASAAARNRAGETAARLADRNGHAEIARILRGGGPPGPRPPVARPAVLGRSRGDRLFGEAARTAWRFVNARYQPATGLVSALAGYHYTTVWDIGSTLAALYCAHELGLVEDSVFDARVRKLLATLGKLPLFEGAAFNRSYSTLTGSMAGSAREGRRGDGWSATDIGRLLLWLKIVANAEPAHADAAAAVVKRLDAGRLVKDGYLRGFRRDAAGGPAEYQEGRVGYEQYAAAGYAAWGLEVDKAASLERNAVPIRVMGRQLAADVRGFDRLTSEPLVLLGMEVGWSERLRALAEELLAAQEERYRRTGRVTVVSEDAIGRPPHYFYYYCAYTNGRHFAVDVQDPQAAVGGPRWVSAKAAFAWHALLPGDYTRQALGSLALARTPTGWASGVYEGTGRSTGTANINTQAVILEAVLYQRRGRPFLEGPGR